MMRENDKTLLILGGTSAVALAYARKSVREFEHICLVGRNVETLNENKADLLGRGAKSVVVHKCDLANVNCITKEWNVITSKTGTITSLMIAYGVLGEQAESQRNIDLLREHLITNYVSVAMWAEIGFDYFDRQGNGQITIIGSVAGDRGRQSNYHYGSAKGALEVFTSGMSHRAAKLVGSKINVLLVKPGFIDTPMTDGMDKTGLLWSTPETIANIIFRAERKGKNSVYAPYFWRFILLLIRMTPRWVFHKTRI